VGDKPPKSAVPTAQTYIYQLRRRFEPWLPSNTVENVLATCGTGYMLRIDTDELDVNRFLRLAKRAHRACLR